MIFRLSLEREEREKCVSPDAYVVIVLPTMSTFDVLDRKTNRKILESLSNLESLSPFILTESDRKFLTVSGSR